MLVELCSVQLVQKLAMLTDGQIIPVTKMLDAFGDDTDEPARARAFEAGPDAEGRWHQDSLETYGFPADNRQKIN